MSESRVEPGPGQESVWDYPRPPRVESMDQRVKVVFGEVTVAYTSAPKRVLETSHPPVYYIPEDDVRFEHLEPVQGSSLCEYKGLARYYDLFTEEQRAQRAAWTYPSPESGYEELAGHIAFYPSLMDNCWVDGEKVAAQEGDFYGGWITSVVTGPFKGAPGTAGW
ncbi:MAG: DUF427 domain-containing protein [Rubrobacter sp.]|nr:DUF427 domain-containing protein [Rubrobacter sp.]